VKQTAVISAGRRRSSGGENERGVWRDGGRTGAVMGVTAEEKNTDKMMNKP